jgi:AcrR family transcriptional regulator
LVQARALPADFAAPSRRDRVRAATSQEIIQTARRLLITHGGAALSLRAIARDMGMTAPALYRYFDSYETLVHHVVADIFDELSDYVEAEVSSALEHQSTAAGPASTASPTDRQAIGLITACQAFRGWAVAHQAEFGMIFGAPLPGVDLRHDDPLLQCGTRFGQIYLRLFAELWQIKPFDVPADGEIPEQFRTQLARYAQQVGTDLPLGALQTFLRCWVSLYGTVTLEVFGHLRFALEDSSQLFELMLTDLAALIGLSYSGVRPGQATRG